MQRNIMLRLCCCLPLPSFWWWPLVRLPRNAERKAKAVHVHRVSVAMDSIALLPATINLFLALAKTAQFKGELVVADINVTAFSVVNANEVLEPYLKNPHIAFACLLNCYYYYIYRICIIYDRRSIVHVLLLVLLYAFCCTFILIMHRFVSVVWCIFLMKCVCVFVISPSFTFQ